MHLSGESLVEACNLVLFVYQDSGLPVNLGPMSCKDMEDEDLVILLFILDVLYQLLVRSVAPLECLILNDSNSVINYIELSLKEVTRIGTVLGCVGKVRVVLFILYLSSF